MEELSGEERIAVFNTLDTETAADALEETEPRVQRQLVATVRRERIVELLNTMTPAQIADILEILPRAEAEALRSSLAPETGAPRSRNCSAGMRSASVHWPRNTTWRCRKGATVGDAIARFRDRRRRYDVVMYVYVVSEEGILEGGHRHSRTDPGRFRGTAGQHHDQANRDALASRHSRRRRARVHPVWFSRPADGRRERQAYRRGAE